PSSRPMKVIPYMWVLQGGIKADLSSGMYGKGAVSYYVSGRSWDEMVSSFLNDRPPNRLRDGYPVCPDILQRNAYTCANTTSV
ncbi:MAG: hypothetical protein QF888_05360, partial [Desulfobacterales bacterium]|nr:hypothetical protein [Desulfobacterales bacterium]